MKKTKLFLSIASMCFALSVLVFGILASLGDDILYDINGTLTYDVNSCFVTVKTSIYYSPDPLDLDEMYDQMENIVNEGDTNNLKLSEVLYYNSYTDAYEGGNQANLNLNFEGRSSGSPKFAYFLKLEVTNLCAFDVNFGVNTPIEIPNNVYSINSGLYTAIGRNESCILSIAFGLESITTNITPGRDQEVPTYSAILKVEPNDENTTLNVYNFNPSTQAISKASNLPDKAIDLYVPSYWNGTRVLKATDFSNCTQLTSIHIPSSVQEVGESIFANCPGLTTLTLPFIGKANYESYDDVCDREMEGGYPYFLRATIYYLFGNVEEEGLVWFNINPEIMPYPGWVDRYMPANLKTVNILYGCKAICEDAINLREKEIYNIETISLPYGIKRIEGSAFRGCRELTAITIPKTVEYLGDNCFADCNNLESITIPSSVTYVGDGICDSCTSLQSAYLYAGTYQGDQWSGSDAFEGCSSLTDLTFGGNAVIGDYAFNRYTSLGYVEVVDTLTSIGTGAFKGCSNITEVSLTSSINYINEDAFANCPSLKTVIFEGKNVDKEDNDSIPFFYDYSDDEFYYNMDDDDYYIYVQDAYLSGYVNSANWADYAADGVFRNMSDLPQTYTISFDPGDNYVNLLVRDPDLWHQWTGEGAVVTDDTGSEPLTNAVYMDADIFPGYDIEYTVRVASYCRIYIYTFNENDKVSNTPLYRYSFSNMLDTVTVSFDWPINKVRFVIFRYNGSDGVFGNEARQLIPSQITTSRFDQLRLSPTEITTIDSVYKTGKKVTLPIMQISPNNGDVFEGWYWHNDQTGDDIKKSTITTRRGSIYLEAVWSSSTYHLYFSKNTNGQDDYVQIQNISAGHNVKVDITGIVDALRSANMLSNGGMVPVVIAFKQGSRGVFSSGSVRESYSNIMQHYGRGDFYVKFTTGDVYLYVTEWTSAAIQQDDNVENLNSISNVAFDYCNDDICYMNSDNMVVDFECFKRDSVILQNTSNKYKQVA